MTPSGRQNKRAALVTNAGPATEQDLRCPWCNAVMEMVELIREGPTKPEFVVKVRARMECRNHGYRRKNKGNDGQDSGQ
jgi:C4-type Zn-finger protein